MNIDRRLRRNSRAATSGSIGVKTRWLSLITMRSRLFSEVEIDLICFLRTDLFDPVADPLPVEIPPERRQRARLDAPERAALPVGEQNPGRHARRHRVAEEGVAKPDVHEQLPERLFYGLPTHH